MVTNHQHPFENRRQSLQREIDLLKSQEERNRLGQFATPFPLAVSIAGFVKSLLKPWQPRPRFADPSIGSGSFYSAALTVFGADGLEDATGIELDPAFAEAANSLWGDFGLRVIQGDFTQIISEDLGTAAPNLVLANPPYVRHHHLNRGEKARLQSLVLQLTGIRVSGLAGLYVYFLLLATHWMERRGVAAWLVPSEFMDVNYGSALREFLSKNVTLIRLHRFDPADVQFNDALVTSAIVIFENAPAPEDHRMEFTFGGSLEHPLVSEMVGLDQLRGREKWSGFPRHADSGSVQEDKDAGPCLGDLFRIQRGIATGCNEFFVLDRAKAIELGIPSSFLRPILPSPRYLSETIVESEPDGYPKLTPQLCLLNCDLPEDLIASKYPRLWMYLQSADSKGIKNGYILRNRNPWYRQEQRAPTPFLCTYMGRGKQGRMPFRFVWNQSQSVATNLYLMLMPIGGLSAMLKEHPERVARLHDWLGSLTARELRIEGRVYGGGLNKIEPKELARISSRSLIEMWPEIINQPNRQMRLFSP